MKVATNEKEGKKNTRLNDLKTKMFLKSAVCLDASEQPDGATHDKQGCVLSDKAVFSALQLCSVDFFGGWLIGLIATNYFWCQQQSEVALVRAHMGCQPFNK